MPRTGFDPRAHGFHFANDFVDKVVTVPGYGEVATDGRSGGMAFAALDYWFAGLPVPSHRPEDFPDRAVPEDRTRLADFIHKRLFDSYATWSARHFLTWTLAEELPRVRHSLDAGRPVVLGLVGARDLDQVARNRQVVAYGYDDEGAWPGGPPMRLFVYDSHHPDTEVALDLDPDRRHWEASAGDGPWRGLFVQDYVRERPPYIDLGAAKGIWVNSWTPTLGGNFVAQFTARNYGEYRARLSELRLAVGDQAARWPEEGAVDVQDGERFELDQRFDLVLNPSSVLAVTVADEDADGSAAGLVREPYLGLDDWGAGDHTYRSRPSRPATPRPDAGEGPWTVAFGIAVTTLDS